jgi:hypothetical protein
MADIENNATSKSTLLNETKQKDKPTVKKAKKDPTLVQHITLNEDFYALTWNACRFDAWKDKSVADVPISLTSSDDTNLILGFIVFIFVVLATVGVLLYESFLSDAYKDANWPIVILRITLVCFAQQKLKPEVFQGISLLRYTFRHSDKFIHPLFAKFVAFCQSAIAIITFSAIFLFCCMADQALDLIMNFAGLAVISELDDWVGEQVMAEKLHCDYESEKFKNANLDKTDLNNRMSLFTKLCVIGEDMELVDDQNNQLIDNALYSFFSALTDFIPWTLIPLLTIPFQYLLVHLQGYSGEVHQK